MHLKTWPESIWLRQCIEHALRMARTTTEIIALKIAEKLSQRIHTWSYFFSNASSRSCQRKPTHVASYLPDLYAIEEESVGSVGSVGSAFNGIRLQKRLSSLSLNSCSFFWQWMNFWFNSIYYCSITNFTTWPIYAVSAKDILLF